MKQQKRTKQESNDPIYFSIIVVLFGISISTFIHDPILHSLWAVLNGWSIDSYESGWMTGSTSILASSSASWQSLWGYFMFPAISIFILTLIIVAMKPEKLIMIFGIITMSLNLPSLNPLITGSDAYNAVGVLTNGGFSEGFAYTMHYLLFFLILVIWGIYLYIVIEDNSKDSKKRVENLYH